MQSRRVPLPDRIMSIASVLSLGEMLTIMSPSSRIALAVQLGGDEGDIVALISRDLSGNNKSLPWWEL